MASTINYNDFLSSPGLKINSIAPMNYSAAKKPSTGVLGLSSNAIPASGYSAQYASNPVNYSSTAQKNQVSGPGASTSTGGASYNPMSNFSPTEEWARSNYGIGLSDLLATNQDAARAMQEAELSSANSAYDYAKEGLTSQIPQLEGQRDRAIGELDLGLSGVRSQVDTSRANAEQNTSKQIRQAGGIAKSTQQQNRNVLRSLGIINSSAAGELLSKPMNEFQTQRADIQGQLGQRVKELDDFLNQKVAEANNAKNGIIAQFTDLYGKIQSDLRFNERQRTDAVKAATASLQQRLADIQNSVFNYQTQIETQKQNFTQGLAQIAAYNNPTIATDMIRNQGLLAPTNQTQTAAVYNPVDQKKKGFLSS